MHTVIFLSFFHNLLNHNTYCEIYGGSQEFTTFFLVTWYEYFDEIESLMEDLNNSQKFNHKSKHVKFGNVFANSYHCLVYTLIYIVLGCNYAMALLYIPIKNRGFLTDPTFLNGTSTQKVLNELPYYNWFPFNHQESRQYYIISVIYQVINIAIIAHLLAAMHTILGCFLIHIASQFQALSESIGKISQSNDAESQKKQLRLCVIHLQHILELSFGKHLASNNVVVII